MSTFTIDLQNVSVQQVILTADTLSVDLTDGRTSRTAVSALRNDERVEELAREEQRCEDQEVLGPLAGSEREE